SCSTLFGACAMASARKPIPGSQIRWNGQSLRRRRTEISRNCQSCIGGPTNTARRDAVRITGCRMFRRKKWGSFNYEQPADRQHAKRYGDSLRAADYLVGDRFGDCYFRGAARYLLDAPAGASRVGTLGGAYQHVCWGVQHLGVTVVQLVGSIGAQSG